MARLFLTENKFKKLSKTNNPEVRIVLSEIINEEDKFTPQRHSWDNTSYINKMSGYNANVVIDGVIAFTINASMITRLVRNMETQINNAYDQLPNNN